MLRIGLGVSVEPAGGAHVYKRRTISENDSKRKTQPCMISVANTVIHHGQVSPASPSQLPSLIGTERKSLASVAGLEEKCLSKRKTKRDSWSVRAKAERSASVLRSSGEKGRWNKSKSSERYEHDREVRVDGME